MDVEHAAESRREALGLLQNVFPNSSIVELELALSGSGGRVSIALNLLLDGCVSESGGSDCVEVLDVESRARAAEDDAVARAPTPLRTIESASSSSCLSPGAPEQDRLVQLLQQVCPQCPVYIIRRVLHECHNDPDIATERLLNVGIANADSGSSSQSLTAPVLDEPRPAPVVQIHPVGLPVEVKYDDGWYSMKIGPGYRDGKYNLCSDTGGMHVEGVEQGRIKALSLGMRVEVKYDGEWYWAEITSVSQGTFQVLYEEDSSSEYVEFDRIKGQACIERGIRLQAVLPDCDPSHFDKVLERLHGDENAALEDILSDVSYPRRARVADGKSNCNSETPTSADDVAPEGVGAEYWFDPAKRLGERKLAGYTQEARMLLLDEFRELRQPGIVKVFEASKCKYAVAWKKCYEAVSKLLAQQPLDAPFAKLQCPRKPHRSVETLDLKGLRLSRLRKEVEFVRWWRQQGKKEEERQKQQRAYFEECEARGLLLECECCYSEHVPEQTIQCAAGHLFCAGCAKHYVDTQLTGEAGLPKLTCTSTSGCQEQLPRSELARVLPKELLAFFDQRLEKASIEAAILQGTLVNIEKCPFCDFVMEMELSPEENKIFVCQAAGCGKESCRLCKEENHIPLKCQEVEKKSQVGHRLSVEENMTAALIRECPACKGKGIDSRFVKIDGCNKMTCPKCKGWVCYMCNEMIQKQVGYGHFCQHPCDPGKPCSKCSKCTLWSGDHKQLARAEQKRVEQAGLEADEAYRAEHANEEVQGDLLVLEGARGGAKGKAKAKLHVTTRNKKRKAAAALGA